MITKEQAILIVQKILKDIDFWGDDVFEPRARLIDGDKLSNNEKPYWLVGHYYGAEDFGPKSASIFANIDTVTGKPSDILSHRNGSIKIAYDEQKDKYIEQK
ncbi:MAG: hypothetical protein HRT58_14065 [Crocinitomicaceae bacterium]|nr:hypothetical protein [Flavobacteriales bacterium]NQZ36790.1 hypothetical protein [Crocinitomicaceae bacterium]